MNHFASSSWENLSHLSTAQTRSISAENPTGIPGQGGRATEGVHANSARELGQGWKISPYRVVPPHSEVLLADIDGEGVIQQIWMTLNGHWRHEILRFYWDNAETPAIEVPVGDFFCCGWCSPAFFASQAVCVNPGSAFNCYWEMPFRKHARVTLENLSDDAFDAFYQINYALGTVHPDAGYLHAEFHRSNPVPYKQVHTILDGVDGPGQYVGTYLAWGSNNNGCWSEGEVKFYMDGDTDFPTICGTGTEDYFCGSYSFENRQTRQYQEFATPYTGLPQVIRPDGLFVSQQRFGLYRWHITDPIRFQKDLRVTIQALGWRSGARYLPLQDDLASTAFFYLDRPGRTLPTLPDRDHLEVI